MKETLSNDEGMNDLRIRAPKEFRFSENLKYLSRSSNECLFDIVDQKIYRALVVENETLLVEISALNETELNVRFPGLTAPVDNQVKDAVSQYVRHWFDLETNLLPFYELAQKDPLLQKPVSQFFGLRNMGIPDLFEAIAWGILGQQINLTYAYTLKRRLVEGFGEYIEFEGMQYWLFPTPDAIAKLTVEDFADLRMTVKKCEYLIGVAQLIAEGELTKEKLLNAKDVKEAEKMLTNIRGIGPWTANYVLMRCLRFPAAFPIDDVGLHNSMKLLMQTEAKPTKAEILKLSEAWADWESYATFYLWRLLY
ncbi:DNA-3-methyladenine glycosylase [Peribacillus frigoritolerans]|uniref:DNA-3-methyladenine glycosylase family protein n=1 Tax=Peribacillus frigoritolerans TaxID=450367 RepID=UPI0024BF9843|nr:DNA-3-methyladenine glycosylase [Peribacillus frigoritolerans]WHY12973.1 DNA-3-methyladenine glycosylase [Peribacillus frigoritolerans]